MTEQAPQHSQKKAMLVVGLMFAMFLGPMAYISYIFFTGDIPNTGTTEKGQFFKPFIKIDESKLIPLKNDDWQTERMSKEGKWAIINFVDEGCDEACFTNAFNTQQAITALTRYNGRVEQLIVARPSLAENKDLQTIAGLKDFSYSFINDSLFEAVKKQTPVDNLNGARVIVDPEAQLLLFYPAEQDVKEILRDIKRLLKSSVSTYSSEEG